MIQLTRKQVNAVRVGTLGKKHWTEKKKSMIGIIKGFYKDITEDNLEWFIEEFVPSEEKRIKREYFQKCQTGEINSTYTPTKFDETFEKVDNPIIGAKYHLYWAFKAAVFRLVKFDEDGIHCYMDNPKYQRENLLKTKISDLRKLR